MKPVTRYPRCLNPRNPHQNAQPASRTTDDGDDTNGTSHDLASSFPLRARSIPPPLSALPPPPTIARWPSFVEIAETPRRLARLPAPARPPPRSTAARPFRRRDNVVPRCFLLSRGRIPHGENGVRTDNFGRGDPIPRASSSESSNANRYSRD